MTSPETHQPQTFKKLREQFHDDEGNYNLLRGDKQKVRGEMNRWDTDYTLEQYAKATDRMIGLMDGSIDTRIIKDPVNPERSLQKPDGVIWLDKSARPVSWFADDLWEQFAEPGVEKPSYDFLNIDRVNWFTRQGHREQEAATRLGPDDFDIEKVLEEDIARIRAYFVQGELTEAHWQEEVWQLPTRLDDKNILIIDEVKNRGGTLAIAAQLIKRAIPEATISGDYFWPSNFYSIDKKSAERTSQQMESAPVWYDNDTTMGRGVGEISETYWTQKYQKDPSQENLRTYLAWPMLSAPHYDRITFDEVPDPKADQLRQDIAYLSYAVAERKVLRTLDKDRPIDQFMAGVAIQGLLPREYSQYREERSKRPNTNK
jgi:hypothetical protein